MENYSRSVLVEYALDMALGQHRSEGVIHHIGKGSQYTSVAIGKRLQTGVRPSLIWIFLF